MPKIELTTMVMIQDKATGNVLVQDRIKVWKGLSFPGGHMEDGESIVDCAMREIKEETGLDVSNLKSCGIIHWLNNNTLDRYLVFLFKTTDFKGELITDSDEGRHSWMTIDELKNTPSENGMADRYLPIFLNDKYNEAFGPWDDNDDKWEIIYK